jgi:RNA polymerase sigma-70 factor, ECF subfamily
MRRPWGNIMYDPTSALSVEDLLGVEREVPESARLSQDESSLIDRCLTGDDTAFDVIVHRYQDMVFNLSYRLLGRHDEAVDLSQDVFLQVYRKLSSFRRDSTLKTWVYRIVINRAKNRQRWWKRRIGEMTAMPLEEAEASPHWNHLESSSFSAPANGNRFLPDQVLERKEIGTILRRAIDALPFDQRTILLLKDLEGLSYEEIATTLDLPLGTVKSRLARGRKALRDSLDPELFGITEDV